MALCRQLFQTTFALASLAAFPLAPAFAAVYDTALVHYEFETLGSGGEVTDSASNGVDLLATGGAASLVAGPNGGNGLLLPDPVILTTTGTTSDDSILNVTRDTPFSIASWIKLQNAGDAFYLASKVIRNVPGGSGSTDLRGWSLSLVSSGAGASKLSAIWRYDNTPASGSVADNRIFVESAEFITDTDWHHVALTYSYDESDATRGIRLYIDGELVGMNTISAGLAGTSDWDLSAQDAPFNLSGRYDTQLEVGGSVDEFAIWNSALTAQQVAGLAGVPEPASLSLLALGLAAIARRR